MAGPRSSLFDRPFYALDTRWASGIGLRDERRIDSVYESGQVIHQFATRERSGTVYVGGSRGLRDGWATRWTTGVTVDERRATALPDALPGSPLPKDRDLIYPWVGVEWVEDDFRVSRNQDQIARTEDVELGWQSWVKLGLSTTALGSDRNAVVFAARSRRASSPTSARRCCERRRLRSCRARPADGHGVQRGLPRYYWRHSTRRSLFVGLSADRGVRLDIDSQLTLGGDNGLRGYPFRFQTGQSRWLFTAEERWFTDWYPFRLFHVGGAVFFDMGQASGGNLVETPALDLGRGLEGRASGCRRRASSRHQPIVRRHGPAHRPGVSDRPRRADAQGAGQRRAEAQLLDGWRASGGCRLARRCEPMRPGHVVCTGCPMDALPQPLTSHSRVTFLACRSGAREHEIASQRRIAERLAVLLGCAFEEAHDEAGRSARPDRLRGPERHPRFARARACARHPRRG
jgi:hypothetical protein